MPKSPKRSFKNPKNWIALGIVVIALGFFIQGKNDRSFFEVSKNLEIYANVLKELNTYYVDEIEPGKLTKVGIDAMLDDLDPYTNYITESDIEGYEFMTTGRYGGIGATMRRKDDQVYIGDVYENSPSQKAGLRPGDLLISIDNEQIKGRGVDDISSLLKGSPGTQVSLKVKDALTGEEVVKLITRGEIELSSVPYAGLVGPDKNIAFVRLTQFTPNCGRLVRDALDSLKTAKPDMKGVVLDLRNNPGGLLDEAVNVCNIFTERGQLVVSTKGKMKDWDKDFKTEGPAWDTKIPLTVLVNRHSASASEIVAGTMQDLDRGVIIGERTYGKGLVQTTRPLGYNARLKLTTARYYTPSGRCIQALDYAHRHADGSVGRIPDSLKQSYKTKGGRLVKGGGGVDVDVEVKDPVTSRLAITLYSKNFLFDYATIYQRKHKAPTDATTFALSTPDWNEFTKWLDTKDYSYKTATEIGLDSLQQTAIREKYYDAAKSEFAALRTKVGHDKKMDLVKNQAEVKEMLESEIISRYYYLKGRIANSLQYDLELTKAISILNAPTNYSALLEKK
ncbi:MAG: S41 family peptidase [Chitinophagaceae bacterium]